MQSSKTKHEFWRNFQPAIAAWIGQPMATVYFDVKEEGVGNKLAQPSGRTGAPEETHDPRH